MAALCPTPVPFSNPIPPTPTPPSPAAALCRAAADLATPLAAGPPLDRREALQRLEAARTNLGQLADALLEAERRSRLSRWEAEGIAGRLRDTRLHLRRLRQRIQS